MSEKHHSYKKKTKFWLNKSIERSYTSNGIHKIHCMLTGILYLPSDSLNIDTNIFSHFIFSHSFHNLCYIPTRTPVAYFKIHRSIKFDMFKNKNSERNKVLTFPSSPVRIASFENDFNLWNELHLDSKYLPLFLK